jgi:putative ABC transport system ATP-binding protein
LLTCSGVTVTYASGATSLTPIRDVSLAVTNQPVAIMGPSGSGKSTLLRVLAGLQRPDAGVVTLDDRRIVASPRAGTTHPKVALVPQDLRLVGFLTVEDNLRLAAELRGEKVASADVENALSAVGLDGFAHRWPATLSGGEQQRVAVARALATRSRVVLADEPTGALDAANSRELARLLAGLAERENVLIAVATHDENVASLLPRVVHLSSGALSAAPA